MPTKPQNSSVTSVIPRVNRLDLMDFYEKYFLSEMPIVVIQDDDIQAWPALQPYLSNDDNNVSVSKSKWGTLDYILNCK